MGVWWSRAVCWKELPTHGSASGNLLKSTATVGEGCGSALCFHRGALRKECATNLPLRGSAVPPAPNPIQFIPILFLPLMIQSFQERLAKACLLLIPRDNQRYVECFRLFWEQKA